MLYYLSTEEYEEKNALFREHLQGIRDKISECVHSGIPEILAEEESVKIRLNDLATRLVMEVMETNNDIHPPILICGMNENGIAWNSFFGIPHGKKIMIIDEDGDKYGFEEFDDLVGETCEPTERDEKVISKIRESQDLPEDDMWTMYAPPAQH